MVRSITTALAIAIVAVGGVAPSVGAATRRFSNCATLNTVYPHGVGLAGSKDKTKGDPVTNFTVNKTVYSAQPKTLDRDKDGIACEKR